MGFLSNYQISLACCLIPQVFSNITFSLCLQWFVSSFLEFRVANSGLWIIKKFSMVQRLHKPVTGEKGAALHKIFHWVVNFSPSFVQFPDVAA